MLQAFESQKKKADMMILKEKKEYKELCVQKSKLNQQLDEKVNVLKEKTEKMSELIEKAKKYSDPSTLELLNKWEISNKKMKDMYEDEVVKREEIKQSEKPPTAKDIDRLINQMELKKPPSKKELPEVQTHKKSVYESESDKESKTNKSVLSNKKPALPEHKSIASNSSKPPIDFTNKRKVSDVPSEDSDIKDDIKEHTETQSQIEKEESKSNLSKPSFSSKPFAKPNFASKPAFGARAPSNESSNKPSLKPDFNNLNSNTSDKLAESNKNSISNEPASFSEKYGLNTAATKPIPTIPTVEETKVSRLRPSPIINYNTNPVTTEQDQLIRR